MGSKITADDILAPAAPQRVARAPGGEITAQDLLDHVPANPKLQPQLVDETGAAVSPLDLDYANSPQDVPQGLRIEQRPTGRDQNVLPGTSGFKANFKAGFVEDPRTKILQHAQALFPNDPEAAKRFGIRDGKIVYIDDDLNIRDVDSGFRAGAGSALAYAPETVGSVIGSFATGNPVTGSALGAAAGKGVKQIVAGTLLDEPQTTAGNLKGMAVEGGVNLVSGGIAKGMGKFADKGRVVDFTPTSRVTAEATRDATRSATGITLDLAQASGDPALMALRKYAAKFPGESAAIFKTLDELQTGQSADAMQRLIALVGKAQSSEAAGKGGISAAQAAIRATRAAVSKEVKPLYDAAYAAVPEVSTATKEGAKALEFLKLPYFKEAFAAGQKLRSLETGSATKPAERITETLRKADPEAGTFESATTRVDSTDTGAKRITSRLTSGQRKETAEGVLTRRTDTTHTDITRPSLAELDYTKRALDEQIESLIDKGQRQRARALKMKRDEFVAALDALPNQEWQAARQRYGQLARDRIEPLENGAVGVLANVKDPKAATAAVKMFTDPNITAKEIAFARSQIEKETPEAWNGLVSQYLGQALNTSLKVTQRGETTNLAGKLYQSLAGTPEQAAKLRAALPAQSQEVANEVLKALKLVAATERAGSDTAFNQLVTRKIEGRFSTTLKMLRQPFQTLIQSGEERELDNMVKNLAIGLTDPAKVAKLKQVTKAPPGLQRSLVILGELTTVPGERAVVDEAFPMADMPIERGPRTRAH